MSSRFLQQLVDTPDRGPGRVFAWFVQIVLIVSILDFTIETTPSISPELRSAFWIVEVVSIVIFSIAIRQMQTLSSTAKPQLEQE